MSNFTRMLIVEKIPGIVCVVACMASVLMGFGVGFIVFGIDETMAYADTATVYQAGAPYHDVIYYDVDRYGEYEPLEITRLPYAFNEALDNHLYLVTISDGYIVVYNSESNGGGVKMSTNTYVGALSTEDQERLLYGIRVYTDEELVRILQNYGS